MLVLHKENIIPRARTLRTGLLFFRSRWERRNFAAWPYRCRPTDFGSRTVHLLQLHK